MPVARATDPFALHLTIFLQQNKRFDSLMHVSNVVSAFFYEHICSENARLIFQITEKEFQAMARFNNSVFSTLRLGADDEKKVVQWIAAEGVTITGVLEKLLGDGFKISCSWVFDQSAFCFSIIGTDSTKDHKDMVMTTWSDDLEEVVLLAGYKHYVVCDGRAWPTDKAGARWG